MAGDGGRCPWCGAALAEDGAGARSWHVVICGACGVGVTRPWPTEAELDAAYPTAYRPADGRFGGHADALLARARGALAGRIDRIAPPGPVLDVGAGDGSLVRAVRATGRRAVGLERQAPEGSDPDLRALGVDQLPEDEQYAAIVFWHSLEHLRDPSEALAGAAARLLPGGILIVAVPNRASAQAQAFGPDWLALDLPRHLTHLNPGALTGRLAELGLAVTRVSHWRGGQVVFGWLHGLVGRLPGRPSLYDAVRREQARLGTVGGPNSRVATIVAAVVLIPVAAVAAAAEISVRRGGTVHVEARRV